MGASRAKARSAPGRHVNLKRGKASVRTRRTTITLPVSILEQAQRLAGQRHQTLSAAVAGLLHSALRDTEIAAQRPGSVMEWWKKSFGGLTEEERLLVDGIIVDGPDSEPK